MKNFLVKVVVNAIAIWIATLVVPGLTVDGAAREGFWHTALTFGVIGLIFGVVNAFIKPVVKLLSLPLYVLSLGLFAFVVNAFMLQITSWISKATPLTFDVDDFFWDAILAAIVVTFVSMVISLALPDDKAH